MKPLPHELYLEMDKYMELIDILRCCQTNKESLQTCQDHLKKKIRTKRRWVNKVFISIIQIFMGGIHTLIFAPKLEYKERFSGFTGYLDGICTQDVPYPIMVGIDDCKRPYITIKTVFGIEKRQSVIVLFQRYTETYNIWTTGTRYYNRLSSESGRVIGWNIQLAKPVIEQPIFKQNMELLLKNAGYVLEKGTKGELIKIEPVYLSAT